MGANLSESLYARSLDDFINKKTIALKEASETKYWLKLLYKSDYINFDLYSNLLKDCEEIIKLLTAIINKLKK